MTLVVTADFETRSRADLRRVGAWRYSRDPSTEAMCLSYALGPGKVRLWRRGLERSGKPDKAPTDLFQALAHGAWLEAHNAFFEVAIWNNVCVPKYKWPALDPDRVICSAAKAAYHCLPRSLEFAALHAGIKVGKDTDGAKVMLKLARPRRSTKHDKREWFDEPELFDRMYSYGIQDTATERELSYRLPSFSPAEFDAFQADMRINLRGVLVDREFVERALELTHRLERERLDELRDVTDGRVETANQVARFKAELERVGLKLPNLTKQTMKDALASDRLTDEQRELLELRVEGSRSSVTKYQAFLDCIDPEDDRVRGLYMYYGANTTGRWAGRLVQPQNFPRGNAKGPKELSKNEVIERMVDAIKRHDMKAIKLFHASPSEVLSTALRGAFVAPTGKVLAAGDYSAIEARKLFWFAEEESGLKVYRAGGDIYREMGSVIFNKPPQDLDEGFERMLGKTVILGCGYGMAAPKFQVTCKSAYNVVISTELAERSVSAYRKRFAMVPKLWYSVDRAAKDCVRRGTPVSYRKLHFRMENGALRMRLPSGRDLIYRRARLDSDGQLVFVNGKGYVETTYGGKLVENACQASSRDLLADAIVRAEFEEPDMDPVMHSHDELVVEGQPGVDRRLEAMMVETPKWAEGLPMKVEAWEGPRYRK